MATTYIGIFSDGTSIEDISLETAGRIEDIVYILKKEEESSIHPTTYTLIDKNGNNRYLDKGNFRLLHIGADGMYSGANHRDIKIKDLRLDKIYNYKATQHGATFFYGEVLPLLEKLDEIGSWEMYQKLIELDKAYKEIEQLKTKVKTLEDKLADR